MYTNTASSDSAQHYQETTIVHAMAMDVVGRASYLDAATSGGKGGKATKGGKGGKEGGQPIGYGNYSKWTCPSCDYWHNGSMVSTCGWCGKDWDTMVAAGAGLAQKGKSKGKGKGSPKKKEGKGYGYKHWWCSICNHDNKSWREECHDCGMAREAGEYKTSDQWAVERYKNSQEVGGEQRPTKGQGKKGGHWGDGNKGAGGPQSQNQETPKRPGLQQPETVAPAKLWKAYELALDLGGASSLEAISYKAKWELAMEEARSKISPAEKRKAAVANLSKTENLLEKAHKDLERCKKLVEDHEKGIKAAKKQMEDIILRGMQLELELYKFQGELAESGPEKLPPPPIDLARLGLHELNPGAAAQAKGLLEALDLVLRLGKTRTPEGAVGTVSREAAALLAAQTGELSAEEAWNSLRGGDKIKLAGGGWARLQEGPTAEENASGAEGALAAEAEATPTTVPGQPSQNPPPTLLDTGTTGEDEAMATQKKGKRQEGGRSRSPSESTVDRRRKKGRGAKEEKEEEEDDEIGDPIQWTQYSRRRGGQEKPSFHEMQAAKTKEEKPKKEENKKGGVAASKELGRQAPRTPVWKKDEMDDLLQGKEEATGGEETANEDFDEEDLRRRSAGEEPFCG